MKKLLIALSIILALSLVFVSCNKNEAEETTSATTDAVTEAPSTEEATTSTDTTETITTPADTTVADETTVADTTVADETTAADTTVADETTAADTTVADETTIADTSAPEESSEADTSAPEETSTEAEETSAPEETTEDENVATPEQVETLLAKVEEAMAKESVFQYTKTESQSYLGFDTTAATTVHYDGLLAHIALIHDSDAYITDIYFLDDVVNVISTVEGEEYQNVVALVSAAEKEYLLDSYIRYSNDLDESVEIFTHYNITRGDNGEYIISLSEIGDSFMAEMEGATVEDAYCNIVIDESFKLVSYELFVKISMDMYGEKMEICSSESCVYEYDVDYVDAATEQFDGYTVVEFEDIFGYVGPHYGRDLGLDFSTSDSFVLDYNNQDRLAKQLDFIDYYSEIFDGKTFTVYGTIEEWEGEYSVIVNGMRSFPIVLPDGITVNNGDLVCITGTFSVIAVDYYETYGLEVSECTVIEETDIPEGGYLPWNAFVTAKTLNVRSSADFTASDNKVGVLTQGTQVKIIGFIEPKYCMIEYHWETEDGQSGEYAYCSLAYLSKLPTYYITLDENYKPANPPV